jgi:hypothetical protein
VNTLSSKTQAEDLVASACNGCAGNRYKLRHNGGLGSSPRKRDAVIAESSRLDVVNQGSFLPLAASSTEAGFAGRIGHGSIAFLSLVFGSAPHM